VYKKIKTKELTMQKGYFGKYGGSFVPPVLDVLLKELSDEFEKAIQDPRILFYQDKNFDF
jgi:tryptophan synthase beta subunit